MSEILKFKGQMADLERETKRLRLKIDGIVHSLRDLLNPMTPAEQLDVAQIDLQAEELMMAQAELLGVISGIERLKRLIHG